jgi:pimeloyl-ACP methyl ester carboxylesterase
MTPKRLVLFSGLGGDGRLMRPLQIPDIDVSTPDYVEAALDEDLPHYAARMAELNRISVSDVVGGASFGGMLAAEIARQRPVAGLILLGTCLQPQRLPWSYKWAERIGRLIPNHALDLRCWKLLLRWRFAPVTIEAEQCLISMAAFCPASRIRAFSRMAINWAGVDQVDCPVLAIHGDRDRIIPLACSEPGVVLRNAGHAFTLTHAEETIVAIEEFLTKVSV